ncbi:hypothetical protein DR864_09405 [Runella rosea]|uniref:Uncharacterized protein n=1 Tax=Runella rosea TaxID=2259595 RepID=A0A344TH14_9BACT|nr:hypothetical protein [Runella rosea]AXE17935.1 hypothetical protein DR864_09405 [Runella rosea]
MKKIFLFSLLSAFLMTINATAQKMLQEVIVDYVVFRPNNMVNKVLAKNKPIKVSLPKGTKTAFYRVTVYQNDKVNTSDTFYKSLRVINPDTLSKERFDFTPYLAEPNGAVGVEVYFFADKSAASRFDSGKEAEACQKIDSTKSAVGVLSTSCAGEELYVGIKKKGKGPLVTVKVEIVALADVAEDPINDRYPFSIQNELSGEVSYEVSGDRTNWQAFFLPSKKKAEFKLADNQVYMRVSTLDKASEEYKIDSGKNYRLYWNKDTNKVDLGEIPAKK